MCITCSFDETLSDRLSRYNGRTYGINFCVGVAVWMKDIWPRADVKVKSACLRASFWKAYGLTTGLFFVLKIDRYKYQDSRKSEATSSAIRTINTNEPKRHSSMHLVQTLRI
jgi:hypothetical protein